MNPLILFFFFFFPVFGLSSPKRCEPFICGKLGEIKFPFYRSNNSELGNNNYCDYGLYKVNCVNESRPLIQLKKDGHWYEVESISQAISITIITENSNHLRRTSNCEEIERFALPFPSPVSNLTTSASSSVTKCYRKVGSQRGVDYGKKSCGDYDERNARKEGRECSVLWIPRERRFSFEIVVNPLCYRCRRQQGKCDSNADNNDFVCSKHNIIINQGKNRGLKLKLGLGIPLVILTLLLTLLMIGFFVRRYKDILLRRNTSDTNMNSDEESKCVYYGIPLFSYKELQEATNNFDAGKELGDGGFGTVYHGVLKDGREVAVKRLYEQNYRRVEQFTNEVEMLTRLRHPNLVTLYGCTSHLSRDLLLVYEYIPNGTLADHLQLDTSWPLRLSVAVETATALAYLHASGIVHRDVKSANILLDAAFAVKVADFGLSRLFPSHVTHVSTAPQGTPGYVDPEYHECYQLTAKSDVYSFGVVLAELLSSMPAVDITRRHHEINLSNFARVKIQSRAFEDLFDPRLNFGQDPQFSSAAVAVAELAFRCLRQDKETRPTMDEVLAELKQIDNISNDDVVMETVKIDESYLLRTQIEKKEEEEPASPNTVTHNWPTNYSIVTPNFSIDKVS